MSRYAVIFRTHFWDQFVQRQFDRLRACVQDGDVFVLVDETRRAVPGIPHDRVLRVTEGDMLAMGLAEAGEGSLLWFNGDYPLYRFTELHGEYEHVLQLEYDVVFNLNVDAMMRRIATEGIDFVALTKGDPVSRWYWLPSCADAYETSEVRYKLICVAAFSRHALQYLRERRLTLSAAFRRGDMTRWPICEAFVATEMARGGFRQAELSSYGNTDFYDHWPPYLEADLSRCDTQPFVHPVLDQPRYIDSMFKYQVGLRGYLHPNSLLHRKLRRLPPTLYLRVLATSFCAKALRTVRAVPRQIALPRAARVRTAARIR